MHLCGTNIQQLSTNLFTKRNNTTLNLRQGISVCSCPICVKFNPFQNHPQFHCEAVHHSMNRVEVGSFIDELYCLKRDYALSNLPPEECIKVVKKPKSSTELKVAQINLFDFEGEVTILELWNDNAILGVRYLWQLLGKEHEILLQFKDLDSDKNEKKRRCPSFKRVEPNSFMRDMYSFPVKARIIAEVPKLGLSSDLKRYCKQIVLPNDVQMLCNEQPIRHFSMWHRTIEEQQEDDDPDDLQRLIMGASAYFNPIGKRSEPDEETKPDKGYVAMQQDEEQSGTTKKIRLDDTHSGKMEVEH